MDHRPVHCTLIFLSREPRIYNRAVTALALVVLSVLIFIMLLQLNGLAALLFFLTAIISVPAIIIQRRETAMMPELGPAEEGESPVRGLLRLAQVVGVDAAGVALGVLWLLFTALLALILSRVVFR
jgi:hypothetical protein